MGNVNAELAVSLIGPEKKVKSFSRVRLCDTMDSSLPGFSVHGILQARILEWITISFSRRSSRPKDQTPVSCIGGRFFTTGKPQAGKIAQGQNSQWVRVH